MQCLTKIEIMIVSVIVGLIAVIGLMAGNSFSNSLR